MAQHDNLVTLAIFEDHNIRQIWHDDEWYFSVVDVVAALTESNTYRAASRYWTTLKLRLIADGFIELEYCSQLKLTASDGKSRETDCANIETLFKIIQFIPAVRHGVRKKGQDTVESSGIYAIINSITQEQYIGSSRDVTIRFMKHRADLRRNSHHSAKLQLAWNQYGEDAFIFVLLENVLDEADLGKIEQIYLNAEEPAYNMDVNATNPGVFAIEETRIQKFIAFLRDRVGLSLKSACFQQLHLLIDHRILIPGPNYQRLSEAEAAGITTWETLQVFLLQR